MLGLENVPPSLALVHKGRRLAAGARLVSQMRLLVVGAVVADERPASKASGPSWLPSVISTLLMVRLSLEAGKVGEGTEEQCCPCRCAFQAPPEPLIRPAALAVVEHVG